MAMSGRRKSSARRLFERLGSRLRKQDLKQVYEKSRNKLEQLGGSMPAALDAVVDDVKTMSNMVGSYSNGSYREVPWRSLAAVGGALLYFIVPVDALPDIVPMAGYIDDAFIIKLVVDLVRKDLEDFKRWRDGGLIIDHDSIKD